MLHRTGGASGTSYSELKVLHERRPQTSPLPAVGGHIWVQLKPGMMCSPRPTLMYLHNHTMSETASSDAHFMNDMTER